MQTSLRILGPALIFLTVLAGCNRGGGSVTVPFSAGQPTALEQSYRAYPPLVQPPQNAALPVPTYTGN